MLEGPGIRPIPRHTLSASSTSSSLPSLSPSLSMCRRSAVAIRVAVVVVVAVVVGVVVAAAAAAAGPGDNGIHAASHSNKRLINIPASQIKGKMHRSSILQRLDKDRSEGPS